jgi:predicted metal-dependent peptidase
MVKASNSGGIPQALAAARMRCLRDRPYLAAALFSLTPVERPRLGTLAVDKHYRLYYDPEKLAEWAGDRLAGVLYHEVCHLLRNHPGRAEALAADAFRWNVAADAEINDDLANERVPLPDGCVYPSTIGQPEGRLAEEYYNAVAPPPCPVHGQGRRSSGRSSQDGGESDRRDGDPGQRGGDGFDSPPSANTADGLGSDGDADADGGTGGGGTDPSPTPDGNGGGAGQARPPRCTGGSPGCVDAPAAPHPRPGAGRCGSAATGGREPWEDGPPGEPGAAPGVSEGEGRVIRRRVAEAVKRFAASAGRGVVPGHWQRWADAEIAPPRVPWQRVLRSALRSAYADTAGAVDYSYRRPSRRQAAYGDVVMPALRRPTPDVTVVIDTSGSVGDDQIAQALGEVNGVVRAIGGRPVRVISYDAQRQGDQRVTTARQAAATLTGGGGTDMAQALAELANERRRSDVVVVITDGETPWPKRPLPLRVVAVITATRTPDPPAWIRTVRIE